MVGARGFEPPTSASRTLRANRTALRPDSIIIDGFELFSNKLLGKVDVIGRVKERRSLSYKTRSPSPC